MERNEALSMVNDKLVDSAIGDQYVTFSVGEEEYGIDVMLVQEIIRYSKPTTVYNSDPTIRGVTNFRGMIIPVIDMRYKFGLEAKELDDFSVVIVIEVEGKYMGLIVDRVLDIMSFKEEDLQKVDKEFAEDIQTQHIQSMGKADNRVVMILSPNGLLSNSVSVDV